MIARSSSCSIRQGGRAWPLAQRERAGLLGRRLFQRGSIRKAQLDPPQAQITSPPWSRPFPLASTLTLPFLRYWLPAVLFGERGLGFQLSNHKMQRNLAKHTRPFPKLRQLSLPLSLCLADQLPPSLSSPSLAGQRARPPSPAPQPRPRAEGAGRPPITLAFLCSPRHAKGSFSLHIATLLERERNLPSPDRILGLSARSRPEMGLIPPSNDGDKWKAANQRPPPLLADLSRYSARANMNPNYSMTNDPSVTTGFQTCLHFQAMSRTGFGPKGLHLFARPVGRARPAGSRCPATTASYNLPSGLARSHPPYRAHIVLRLVGLAVLSLGVLLIFRVGGGGRNSAGKLALKLSGYSLH
ncbi:uncharacterized protein VTP21DRAFT_8488 [Calcarisporiella thermophila]|uniref:uncharacterized protein n=1 Tax=Calcarisporiella thermophila TaxID=911321 RepID=UPI00374269A2